MLSPRLLSRSILLVPVFLVASVLAAGGEEKERPATPKWVKGGKVISATAAKGFLDRKEAEFYDMRPAATFAAGHIPGARALPYHEQSECAVDFDASVDRFDLVQLPPNKGKAMVFYCEGPNGWRSYKAAVLAIRTGYRDVLWLRDGFPAWQAAGYPVE